MPANTSRSDRRQSTPRRNGRRRWKRCFLRCAVADDAGADRHHESLTPSRRARVQTIKKEDALGEAQAGARPLTDRSCEPTTLSPGSGSAQAVADVSTRRRLSFFDLAENEPMLNRRSNVSRLTPTLLLSQPASPKLTIVRNGQRRGSKYS